MDTLSELEKLIILITFLSVFCLAFLVNPILGISVLAVLRGLFTFTFINIGPISFTMEGVINFVFLIMGLFTLAALKVSIFRTPASLPFFLMIFFLLAGITYASDHVEFIKKFSRILSYYVLYMLVVNLSRHERAVRWFVYSVFVALFGPILLGVVEGLFNFPLSGFHELPQKGFVHSFMTKNSFGFFCAFMILFSVSFYINMDKHHKRRPLLVVTIIVMFILMILSLTRAAWLGCFAGFLTLLVLTKVRKKHIPLLLVLAVVVGLFMPLLTGAISGLAARDDDSISSWEIRKDYIWPNSWKAFRASPIYGCGLGNDYLVTPESTIPQGTHVYSAHNDYLTILVETGFIGFTLYGWLIGSMGMYILKNYRGIHDPIQRSVCLAGLAVLAGFLTGGFFEHLLQAPAVGAYVFTIVAMAQGVCNHHVDTLRVDTAAIACTKIRQRWPRWLHPQYIN
ncbi:MAG: O-antigen ligase family protein [Sedimentisphaerales bacterium]|nr:O-antigen ligase family protein [Sedimentisphaerales bacterium]